MTEAQMQATIIAALKVPQAGEPWMLHHDTDARRSHSGGWPDLFAIHVPTGRVLVLELKSAKGRMRPGQAKWLAALMWALAPEQCVGVCRPDNLDDVLRWIAARDKTEPPRLTRSPITL